MYVRVAELAARVCASLTGRVVCLGEVCVCTCRGVGSVRVYEVFREVTMTMVRLYGQSNKSIN